MVVVGRTGPRAGGGEVVCLVCAAPAASQTGGEGGGAVPDDYALGPQARRHRQRRLGDDLSYLARGGGLGGGVMPSGRPDPTSDPEEVVRAARVDGLDKAVLVWLALGERSGRVGGPGGSHGGCGDGRSGVHTTYLLCTRTASWHVRVDAVYREGMASRVDVGYLARPTREIICQIRNSPESSNMLTGRLTD